MQFERISRRAFAAIALAAVCGAVPAPLSAVHASTPATVWKDVARINVLCLVNTEAGVDQGTLNARICADVRDMASRGAPVPAHIIAPGDPALLAPDSLTLLVHASVQDDSPRRLLAFLIRPFRNAADQFLFTAAPRAVPLGDPSAAHPELEAALRAALSETLPWLSAPAGPRPIR